MGNPAESTNEEPVRQDRRFDQEQYDFLKECSEKGEEGINEWNQWREKHRNKDIHLEEADLCGWYLRGANFVRGTDSGQNSNVRAIYAGWVYLREADFKKADVRECSFGGAHLEETRWWLAKAQGTDFTLARLEGAQFEGSELDGCRFDDAVLKDASLTGSSLRGAWFTHSDLRGCCARVAITDGATIIWRCMVDNETDFTGVGLDNIRIDPGTKQRLECSVRRRSWKRWYTSGEPDETVRGQAARGMRALCPCIATSPVRLFWFISDYGCSTGRIVATFFVLAAIFAALYYVAAIAMPPGVVNGLFEGKEGIVPGWMVPVRAVYFSIVTMTTLGFGDMYANCQSFWGHVLLTLQVLLGYVLLGALVTRFAVLFTAGGPAGRFAGRKGHVRSDK